MRPPHVVTLAALFLVVPLAGCTGAECDVFEDADKAVCDSLGGQGQENVTFEVPSGSDQLTVKRNFAGGGQITYSLKDPAGATAQPPTVFNGGQAVSDTWYTKDDPRAGTWTISITYNGGVAYTFGVYY